MTSNQHGPYVRAEANIIFGATFDETMQDEIRVTVIATGFDEPAAAETASAASARPAAKPQVLFTGAAEKAAAAVVPPLNEEETPAPPAETTEDPFDSIFKIFNSK